jgi:hypothetical protein
MNYDGDLLGNERLLKFVRRGNGQGLKYFIIQWKDWRRRKVNVN